MKNLLKLIFELFYSDFAWGFFAYMAYPWFIQSVYQNAINITYLQFVGISYFITFFKYGTNYMKEEDLDYEYYMLKTLDPWMCLLGAWSFKVIFL